MPDRRALRRALTARFVSREASMPSPMPLDTYSVSRSAVADQSKLSPKMAYAGSSWAPSSYSGREQERPGSSCHCISAARVSRSLRRACR